MANISVSLPSDGETIEVADYNTPINTIVNEFNGGIDDSNIASGAAISGSKLADKTVTTGKMDGGSTDGVLLTDASGNVTGGKVTAIKTDFTTYSGTTTQWRDWTPTLTNFTGTVNQSRYTLVGKMCEFYIEFTQGASVTGRHTFSLPVQAASTISTSIGWGTPIARGQILDLGAQVYDAFGGLVSSTTCALGYMPIVASIVTQAPTSGTAPMTWVNGNDKAWLYGKYETI